jgi:predicted PurR-regulated permease PerM
MLTIWFYKIGLLSVFIPVVWSLFFAYLFEPIVRFIEKFKIKRPYAIIILYLILILIMYLAIRYVIPELINNLTKLVSDVPLYANNIMKKIDGIRSKMHNSMMPKSFNSIIDKNIHRGENFIIGFINSILNGMTHAVSKVLDIILIPIITFYILKDGRSIKQGINNAIPKRYRHIIMGIGSDVNLVMSQFIHSQLIVGLFVGTLTTIAMMALKIELALFIGIIAGVGEIIPYFGPILSGIPAIMLAYLDYPMKAVWVLVIIILIQQVEGNIISPKVMGDSLGVHPLIVMFSIIIGGKYFGIIGMLMAVPVACILKVLLTRIYKREGFLDL